jgi:EmrB/QacA subfamily drug resistance transporter
MKKLLLIASFGSFLLNLSATTINVAIDRLMGDLHAPLSQIQWIVTGYLLALTLVLPSFRFCVDRLGSRRLYAFCLLGFAATSVLCACAWSAPTLIAFRILQGAVGGLLSPLAQTLSAQLAGPERMGRAVSFMALPVLISPLLGPLLGGLLVESLSWRWLFLFNVPLALLGAFLAWRYLPPGDTSARSRLDFLGLALLSPGIALFTYALSQRSVLLLAPAVVLIAVFLIDARRRPETALLDLGVFKNRAVSGALATLLLVSFASFGGQFVLPLYFQQVRGETAMHTGLLIAPQGLGMLLTLPQIGRLSDRFDNGKIVMVGVTLALLGTVAFTLVHSYPLLCVALLLRGAGLGAIGTPALAAAYRHLKREELANATTSMNIVQRLGAPIGTAVMAVTLQRFLASSEAPRAFANTFLLSAALSAPALLGGFMLRHRRPADSPLPLSQLKENP